MDIGGQQRNRVCERLTLMTECSSVKLLAAYWQSVGGERAAKIIVERNFIAVALSIKC